MMKIVIFLISVLFLNCLSAETVYKTMDEEGNVIFTDQPSDEAEEIKIQKLETIKNPNTPKYTSRPTQEEQESDSNYYESFTVTSPENGAGIRSNAGNVSISLAINPTLKRGHRIVILMDGKEVGTGLSASLQNVDRGTHSISAKVVDSNGKNIISTSSSFSLLRATK
jgi:archaellum component FlaG (FlaF/FlaG flagellin family)